MSRKNRTLILSLLLIILALVVFALTGCGKPKGHLQGILSYLNMDADDAGYINHAEITMHGTDLPLRSAFTDVNGQYQISNVLVGKYEVIANLATATNLSDFDFPFGVYWSSYSLNDGTMQYCDVTGNHPDLSFSIGDVVIADDTITTLDLFLYGY